MHGRQCVHVPDFDGAVKRRGGQEAGVSRLEFAVKDGFDVALGTQQEKSQQLREIHVINKQTTISNQAEPCTMASKCERKHIRQANPQSLSHCGG